MMIKKIYKILCAVGFVLCGICSCSEYLDLKPDNVFSVPNSLQDLQGLLDNSEVVMNFVTTGLGETASDSYYLTEKSWAGMAQERDRLIYLWQPYSPVASQWTGPYRAILYANTVLEYLPSLHLENSEMAMAKNLKGSALFHRAHQLFNLLQVFSLPYDPLTDNGQLGVVLRREPSLDEPLSRSSVKECYDFVIKDLEHSIQLLPEVQNVPTRPSKAAAYAELARVYLTMSQFDKSGLFADSALSIKSGLLDYETEVTAVTNLPFSKWNKEVLFDVAMNGGIPLSPSRRRVSKIEYDNYEEGDIRKEAFFSFNDLGEILFKGNYNGLNSSQLFCGTTVAEMYLIRAEANARLNNLVKASDDLNILRKNRFKKLYYEDIRFVDKEQALLFIKKERRRELIFRGQRWGDLRRYILKGEYEGAMSREGENKVYTMSASDIVRYTYRLPDEVVDNGGLIQND